MSSRLVIIVFFFKYKTVDTIDRNTTFNLRVFLSYLLSLVSLTLYHQVHGRTRPGTATIVHSASFPPNKTLESVRLARLDGLPAPLTTSETVVCHALEEHLVLQLLQRLRWKVVPIVRVDVFRKWRRLNLRVGAKVVPQESGVR